MLYKAHWNRARGGGGESGGTHTMQRSLNHILKLYFILYPDNSETRFYNIQIRFFMDKKVEVNQSGYRPEVAQRVPGS